MMFFSLRMSYIFSRDYLCAQGVPRCRLQSFHLLFSCLISYVFNQRHRFARGGSGFFIVLHSPPLLRMFAIQKIDFNKLGPFRYAYLNERILAYRWLY